MPELPDVEGFRRYLARHAKGRAIRGVEVRSRDMLRNTTPQALGRAVAGRRFSDPRRHGKWLIAPTGDARVPFHFGMTGDLVWAGADGERLHIHDRIVFRMRGGELRYRNMRKFGGIWLAGSDAEVQRVTGPLGPDAGRVDRERFEELLRGRRGALKATLMNQRIIAGIGNELSDEILWQARLNPRRSVSRLRPRSRNRLLHSIREVIRVSNRHGRIPRREGWITSQRRAREPRCPRCSGRVRRETIAGRTAYWCPRCQRSG